MTVAPRFLAIVSAAVLTMLATRVPAQTPPCVGRFLVSGTPIGPGSVAPDGAFVVIAPDVVEIPGVCTPIAPKVRKANKKGITTLKAQWPVSACRGFSGKKVTLAAKIAESCTKLTGNLKAKKAKRKVQAAASRCGDNTIDVGGREACEPPGSATCDTACQRAAGELPAALGIASYAVNVPASPAATPTSPVTVVLKNGTGQEIGTISSSFGDDGFRSDFVSPDGEQGSVETFIQDRDDFSPPRHIRSIFRLADRWLKVDLTGQNTLTPGWLDTVTLTTNLDPGADAPSLGMVLPGADGLEAALATVVGGELVVDETGLDVWLRETGLQDLATSYAIAALFATGFDENLLLNIASQLGEGEDTHSEPLHELHPLIHKGPGCLGLTLAGGTLSGTVCGACIVGGISSFGTGGLSAVLTLPACGYCKWVAGASFIPWATCKFSEYNRVNKQTCDTFVCPPSDEPQVEDKYEHSCWCTCNASKCAASCMIYPQQLGTTFPDGSPRPALPPAGGSCIGEKNSCVCTFDPDAYCKSTFPNYCGGGRRLADRSLDIDCPRVKCGDGRWDETCPAHTEQAEICDGSAPSQKTGNCGFNRGCRACACVDCTCGPDTDTPTCPKGDKGAYCDVADCQCHEGCLVTADCPSNKTCIGGACLGEGSLRITLRWNGNTDLDLHVITPLGNEIYFGNREADSGTLDVDQCVSSCEEGVENVFFVNPPPGQYEFWAVNYNGEKAVRANFRAVNSGGDVLALESEFVAAAAGTSTSHFSLTQ